jgi:nitroreductase/FMN reductase [NAD(P)H]
MQPSQDTQFQLQDAIRQRFGQSIVAASGVPHTDELVRLLQHRSHRAYTDRVVDDALLQLLYACALSAPTKSDLQQADIVRVAEPSKRQVIADLIDDMPWVRAVPVFLVFCGNNRRIRQVSALRSKPFANDHLDAFFNAAVDAAIVLTTFIHAARAVGLGCCPISAIRDHAEAVSETLELPQWVFPVAGLCVGYPAKPGHISPRLPLNVTVHTDRFDESKLQQSIEDYDHRRDSQQPYVKQRDVERFGVADFYGWSEDKARQYAHPQRQQFGRYVRAQGFNLD